MAYKQQKEAFVSGSTGGSILKINQVCLTALVSSPATFIPDDETNRVRSLSVDVRSLGRPRASDREQEWIHSMARCSHRILHPRRAPPRLPYRPLVLPPPRQLLHCRHRRPRTADLFTSTSRSQQTTPYSQSSKRESRTPSDSSGIRQAIRDRLSSPYDAHDRHMHPRCRFQRLPTRVLKGRDLGYFSRQSDFNSARVDGTDQRE
jgi:hypothetical protein